MTNLREGKVVDAGGGAYDAKPVVKASAWSVGMQLAESAPLWHHCRYQHVAQMPEAHIFDAPPIIKAATDPA